MRTTLSLHSFWSFCMPGRHTLSLMGIRWHRQDHTLLMTPKHFERNSKCLCWDVFCVVMLSVKILKCLCICSLSVWVNSVCVSIFFGCFWDRFCTCQCGCILAWRTHTHTHTHASGAFERGRFSCWTSMQLWPHFFQLSTYVRLVPWFCWKLFE